MITEKMNKQGYKKTSLGWIPEEWGVVNLGELMEFKNGVNAGKEAYGSGVKFINVMEVIENNCLTYQDIPGRITLDEKQKTVYAVNYGDVMFNRTSETPDEIGLTAVYLDKNDTVFGGFVIRGRSKNSQLDYQFRKDCFRSPILRRQIIARGQGAVRANIGQRDLEQVLLPVPPLPEQQKIATILSTWDEAIRKCEDIIEQLKTRNQGLAQQLLTGKKRLPGFSGEWKEYAYKDVLKKVKRPVEWDNEELYALISVRRRSGGIFRRDALYGHQIKVKNLFTARTGDFLFSKMQIVHGASAMVTDNFNNCKISGSYIAVRAKNESVFDIEFLNWYSKLPVFYHQTYVASYGVHIEKMTFDFKLFLTEKIKLPGSKEQRAIIRVLEEADRELRLYQDKLTALQEQKKGLMQKLLTGEVRVKID